MSKHRQGQRPLDGPSVRTILIVLAIGFAVLGALVWWTYKPDPNIDGRPVAKPTPKVTITATASPGPLAMARDLKPLAEFARGDRALYKGKVVIFRYWNGSIDSAAISYSKGGKIFIIKTGFLTPAERAK